MFRKLTSAITGSGPRPPSHHAAARAETYVELGKELQGAGVPVDLSDCATCDHPCPIDGTATNGNGHAGTVVEAGQIWDGKSYEEYVLDKYGDVGEFPSAVESDWDSELAGSGSTPRGRCVVISTGKSDWEHNHLDEKQGFARKLDKYISSLSLPSGGKGGKFSGRPPVSSFISPIGDVTSSALPAPSMYSSSLLSQSDDPEDQSVLVFPDWKVVHEVENSAEGAKGIFEDVLRGGVGKAGIRLEDGQKEGVGRRQSWVLPYRAVVLLCSHKRRDKRCHIAAPLLRSALITCFSKYDISVDETGGSLINLSDTPLEDLEGSPEEREAEVNRQKKAIEGVEGGEGGEVGIFNINHLGGHRYAGVMLVLFPSGAFMSYGRVTPQEIPRVVEETILKGKIVPGLLRNAAGVVREGADGKGFLGW